MSDVLTKALALAAADIPVFPCAADKRPTCPHGFKDATCEPSAVATLWRDHPGPLIGVPTGAASGIFVLDIDSAKHPEAEEWLERHAPYLPDTRHHRTRSGGLHILFKHCDGLKNSTSKLARGVDTRGDGGYIIWWPAAIAQAKDYQDLPFENLPEWMVEALAPPPPPKIVPQRAWPLRDSDSAASWTRLRGIVAAVALAREGERNCITFWAACTIRDMLIASELDNASGEQAFAALIEAGHRSGLRPYEIKRTIASATRPR
jgi:Bifunctional DNA primase/polymerase, N-terminal